jgi:hypothetical protein
MNPLSLTYQAVGSRDFGGLKVAMGGLDEQTLFWFVCRTIF